MAQDAGVVVAFVTARPPHSVDALSDHMSLEGVAVCCNGAMLYDLKQRQVIEHRTFPVETCHALINTLREAIPGVSFAVQNATDFSQEPHFPPYWDDWYAEPVPRVACALTVLDAPVAKIIAHHGSHGVDGLTALVATCVGDRAHLSHSGLPIVELAPAGVTKASGLEALCSRLGISASNVVAFGDMPNDLEMLAFAGHSVGVANAHPDVLALVSEITLSNDQDGVAVVIERLLG